ncbi:YqjD family protein [Oceaniovalibus sp. ACAM 378]|jgi:ElaB/YqjD/DUF883 family membrane-anchored ribosome-binding protein|uniref:DUF883 family protein n=1 Tax=Oceaniovalibus sp. ACAM 378 TaxID=2599923 RepID=UPI0011D42A84|nr:DUF883 family protein [Oceaniovalibus sp. ACAM 378]TYB89250.1 DUF883 domain-containing protein [Oceaniovalibus sp. ACAM 378]
MATTKTPTPEDLSMQIDQLKLDIALLTETITDIGKSKGDELADTVRSKARSARAAGEEQVAELQRRAQETANSAEDYVRANPAAALGIAAGFGLLVGLITSRR